MNLEEFELWDRASPMIDKLGDFRRHKTEKLRFGFTVDTPKLNGRGFLHAGAMSTIADVVLGHSLSSLHDSPTRYVTTSLQIHFLGVGEEGDWIDVEVTPIKTGRRLGVGSVTFRNGHRQIGFATAAFTAAPTKAPA